MDFRSFLPERAIEDIIAERVRVTVGGEEYILPAKSVEENELWLEGLNKDVNGLLDILQSGGDDTGAAIAILTRNSDYLIEHLTSYDHTGVLPDRAALRSGLTPIKLILTVLEVWRAANPLVDIALTALTLDTMRTVVAAKNGSSPPTASRPKSSGGRRATSAKN